MPTQHGDPLDEAETGDRDLDDAGENPGGVRKARSGDHCAAEPLAAHHHFGDDHDDHRDRQCDLKSGQDLRQAAGRMISRNNCRSLAPRLRADHSSCRSTPSEAAIVAVMTGKIALNTAIEIFETSYSPSHNIKIGRKAIFGIGKPTETIGSKNQRTQRRRAIKMPSVTPPAPAIAKPASERNRVSPRLRANSPDIASSQTRPNTAEIGGSRNGVTMPLREAASQATITASSGTIAPARRVTAPARSSRMPVAAGGARKRVSISLIRRPYSRQARMRRTSIR